MKRPINQTQLEREAQALLTQSLHMQIVGNPKLLEKRKGTSVKQLQGDLEQAVLTTRVGDLLRQARLQRGLTGEEAGALFGVKRARVSQMEARGDALHLSGLVRYAQSLGFDVRLTLVSHDGHSVLSSDLQ